MSILARAVQRWEAESGAMRSLSGLPYDLDMFVAGFVLGYRKEPCPPGMHLDSFRVGHRSGEAERRIADREMEHRTHEPGCPGAGRCHGPQKWCDACGDVADVCDDSGCAAHAAEGEP